MKTWCMIILFFLSIQTALMSQNTLKGKTPAFKVIEKEIREGGVEKGWMKFKEIRSDTANYTFGEADFNNQGYAFLYRKAFKEALAIFEMIITLYPNSSNAYDSYAEAWLASGDKENARKYYNIAIEKDPSNPGPKSMLANLDNYKLQSVKTIPLPEMKFYAEDDELPLELRMQTFNQVWELLRDNYYDPKMNGVDWVRIKEVYEPRVKLNVTSRSFHALMSMMANELKSSHLAVISPASVKGNAAPSQKGYTIDGVEIRLAGKNVIFFRVDSASAAWKAGLRPGDLLLKADSQYMSSFDTIAKASTRIVKARRSLNGKEGSQMVIQIKAPSGDVREITLVRTIPVPKRYELMHPALVHSLVTPDVGYIWFDCWGADLPEKLSPVLSAYRNTKGIILDLRQNPGGMNPGGDLFATWISAEDGKIMIDRKRNGEVFEWTYPGSRDTAYTGKVVILLDEMSASTSEVITAAFQETGRVTVIGSRSYGGVLNSTQALLPTGGALQYPHSYSVTPKGRFLEGTGVIPDFEVELQPAQLAAGKDSLVEKAIEIIVKK